VVPRRRGRRPDRQPQARPEGVVGMPLASRYHPGQRRDWIKIKNVRHQEVIICGWQPGWGSRASTIGSLILGVYDDGQLGYAGNVGTGFTEAMLAGLLRQLIPLHRETSPFATAVPPRYARGAHWVEPRLVGEGGVHRMDRRREHAPPELAGAPRRQEPR
jgi:bifunctional non-homologous end joining protein LigD